MSFYGRGECCCRARIESTTDSRIGSTSKSGDRPTGAVGRQVLERLLRWRPTTSNPKFFYPNRCQLCTSNLTAASRMQRLRISMTETGRKAERRLQAGIPPGALRHLPTDPPNLRYRRRFPYSQSIKLHCKSLFSFRPTRRLELIPSEIPSQNALIRTPATALYAIQAAVGIISRSIGKAKNNPDGIASPAIRELALSPRAYINAKPSPEGSRTSLR